MARLPSDKDLLAELDSLDNLLRQAPADSKTSALLRLVRSDLSWPELANKLKQTDWTALPLRRDKFPALNALKDQLETLTLLQGQDPLTGLANRRSFDQALALEVQRSTRFKTPLSLCIIDLDDFKKINDSYGHPCGDTVLQAMAALLKREIRMVDLAARLGGEEFALLLPGTGLMRAQKLLERVLASIRTTQVQCEGQNIKFSASLGLASYRGKEVPDAAKLMAAADKALYQAKRAGKNRMECAPLLDLGQKPDQTLVQQNEKRFLFS